MKSWPQATASGWSQLEEEGCATYLRRDEKCFEEKTDEN